MGKTDALILTLTVAYGYELKIDFVGGTHFSVWAIQNPNDVTPGQEQRKVVGIGSTSEQALQDCLNGLKLAEELDERIKQCLCGRRVNGKFTCNKSIAPMPAQNSTNSSYWCSICTDCQKAEMEQEARSDCAAAARVERDYR